MVRRRIKASKVAEMTGLSVRQVKRLALKQNGDFPKSAMRNGVIEWMWDAREVEAWVEKGFDERDRRQAEIREALRFERKSA